MNTKVCTIHDIQKDYGVIQEAAVLLKEGHVVAFPTETVYGLGANALDAHAVRKIFEAKGRPGDNPLIVHINHIKDIYPLVKEVPEKTFGLMKVFWPGPLTIILEKSELVPEEVTAGLSTVALRIPSHPVARALIEASGLPIAAPSANLSGRPSPTQARHVMLDMNGRIPLVVDGGSCAVGVESTVLDMTGKVPVILRPGGVTREMLQSHLGEVEVDPSVLRPLHHQDEVKSPGMKYMHYAPKASVVIAAGPVQRQTAKILEMMDEAQERGKKVGILATEETVSQYPGDYVLVLGSRSTPESLAVNLFARLREFDELGVDLILAEGVEIEGAGLAVMNRMARAAGFNIIEV